MPQYDPFAKKYHEMVQSGGSNDSYSYIIEQLQSLTDLHGKKICDVGCGQGELSCRLSSLGADVTGVDLSEKLLAYAGERTERVEWILDDAMELKKLAGETYDYVVSSLMLMDVPRHDAVFEASHRILKPNGIMIWVITHPCFQSPFSHPLGDGSRKVLDYTPQYWKSAGTGTIRSTLGAYHRRVADYINDFMSTGFSLIRVDEPERHENAVDHLPSLFAVVGRKVV